MRTLPVVVLVVALSGAPALADEPVANGTRGVVVAAQPGQDVQMVEVEGRVVPNPVDLATSDVGDGLLLVERPIDLPMVLAIGDRTVEVGPATTPAVVRISGPDRRATAVATARTTSSSTAVAAATDRVDLALLAATGPWPVLWSLADAAATAPDVVDLADFPSDAATFAVAWDQHVRGDGARDRVFLVTDRTTADLAAVAALGEPTFVTGVDQLPAVTRAALVRLAPDEIIVVGGRSAVSEAVEAEVTTLAATVRRLAGADRAGTAAVLRNLWPADAPTAIVRGDIHVDAVAAASLDVPIIFAAAARELFASGSCRSRGAIIVGGQAAVPDFEQLPTCRITAQELAHRLVAELRELRPAAHPAKVEDMQRAVDGLSMPLDVRITAVDGLVTSVEFTVSRARPDGGESTTARWDDGDLSKAPDLIQTSSTVAIRD